MALVLAFSTLVGCGAPEQPSAPTRGNAPQTSVKSAKQIHKDRAVFVEMAPPGWSLQRFDDGIASYNVIIPQRTNVTKIGIISGSITLDGRNEPMVKLGSAIPRLGNQSDHEREAALELYPDFEGYKKDVAVGSIGYAEKRGEDIHAVAYYNLDKNISCYGHVPKQFRCYWGTHAKRMGLFFHSDDLGVVLPYVLEMADAD
ncbi:hypothetical protein [Sphingopyxis fribergensis]